MRAKFIGLLVALVLVLGISLNAATPALAAVTLTAATGGSAIPANTAVSGIYTALSGPVIAEASKHNIEFGSIILNVPSGFQFDTGGIAPRVIVSAGSTNASLNINQVAIGSPIGPVTVTPNTISVTITDKSESPNTLTWQNIRVKPTATHPLASGNITNTGSAPGVPTGSANFGTLTEIATPAAKLAFSSVPGNGVPGQAFSVTVQSQDVDGNPSNPTSNTTITLSKASGSGTLSGNLIGTIFTSGNATTISNLIYSAADTLTLTATATAGQTGLSPATSGNIAFIACKVTATAGSHGTISPSGQVSVNYGANQSFTIAPEANYHVTAVTVDSVSAGAVTNYTFTNVTADHTIAATFNINTYTLTISTPVNGFVTATDTSGILPSGPLSGIYAGLPYGDVITLTATPNSGYFMNGWSSGVNNNHVTITADTTVAATFTAIPPPPTYTLTMATSPISSGTAIDNTDGSPYPAGASISITAVPSTGYHFVNWTAPAGTFTNAAMASTTFNMPASATIVTATFNINAYTLTISAPVNGIVTATDTAGILPSGPLSGSYNGLPYGDVITLTATPNSGYFFNGWSGGVSNNHLTIASDTTVTATFTATPPPPAYTLTMAASPIGSGTATDNTSGSPYSGGASISITAVPATGYHFVNWTAPAGTFTNNATATTTFNMPASAVMVTANFSVNTYTLTISVSANGVVTATDAAVKLPSGPLSGSYNGLPYGDVITLTATPNSGYFFNGWSGGVSNNHLTIGADTTVTATFTATPPPPAYTLTMAASPISSGTATDNTSGSPYSGGASISITAVPATGYHFVNWTAPAGTFTNNATATTTFNMPAAATIVTANFAIDQIISGGGSPGGGGGSSGGSSGSGNSAISVSLSGLNGNLPKLNESGVTSYTVQLTSSSNNLAVNIPAGTKMLNANGTPLTTLSVTPITSPPPSPSGTIVMSAFEFGPQGATFNPSIILTVSYEITALPEGVLETSLSLSWWDGTNWQPLSCNIDANTKTVTANVPHFTQFALFGARETTPAAPIPATSPTPTPTPESTSSPIPSTPALTPTHATAPEQIPAPTPSDSMNTPTLAPQSIQKPEISISSPTPATPTPAPNRPTPLSQSIILISIIGAILIVCLVAWRVVALRK